MLATTATANQRVTADVAAQLGDATARAARAAGPPGLRLSVVTGSRPLERYAWVVDHLRALPGSGIVYALTVAEAERLADRPGRARPRGPVARTPGSSTPPSASSSRTRCATTSSRRSSPRPRSAWATTSPTSASASTSGRPPSPVSYYQQVGRAGRAIDDAHAVLLPSEADERIWEYFATATIPDPSRSSGCSPRSADGPSRVPALEAVTGVRRGRLELLLKLLAVDGAVERRSDGWVATGRPWQFDAAQ